MPASDKSLYDLALEQGIPIDHHESDLYLKNSPITRALLRVHNQGTATAFRSQLDGELWWDVPFAYAPWWRAREADRKQAKLIGPAEDNMRKLYAPTCHRHPREPLPCPWCDQ